MGMGGRCRGSTRVGSVSNLDAPSMVMGDLAGDTQSEVALRMIVVFGGMKRIKMCSTRSESNPPIRIQATYNAA